MKVASALEHYFEGCVHGKWLHEDCVSETVLDANGRLKMCSGVVVLLFIHNLHLYYFLFLIF